MLRFSVFLLVLLAAPPLSAYVVNDTGDAPDATPGDNICATAGAVCTLRAAIMEANANPGTDPITFSVAGTISPASALPAITERVDIDATTAPGYTTAPVVNLVAGAVIPYGLDFAAGSSSSTLAGLQIAGFATAAVRIASDSVTLRRNYLGPVTVAGANGAGLELGGNGSTIGGTDGNGNVISGNQGPGIIVTGSGHFIRDNFIGTNAAGTAALGNSSDGVVVQGATGVTIGSATANEWNVISGNSGHGVNIESGTGNTVAGNFIGTDLAGTTGLGNNAGVRLLAGPNTVGTTAARNVVSGNGAEGIIVASTSGVVIHNNYVGVDITGNAGIGNGAEGIRVTNSSNIAIGGNSAGQGNVASFNTSDGISIAEANDIAVYGNIAGLNAAGSAILGNGFAGIAISAGTNIFVGTLSGGPVGRNIVSGNSFGGIVSGFGTGNVFENNYVGTGITGNTAGLGNLGTGILIGGSDGDIIRSNVVSGNASHGIEVTLGTTNAVIHSNLIGVGANGSTSIPNTGDGVNVCDNAANTVVGSIALGGNTIMNNGANGIGVEPTALLGNTWAGNSIDNNTLLGIDLSLDGVTANDVPGDPDTGPNSLQNFPTILSAVQNGVVGRVYGSINTTPNTAITIHVYRFGADPSGFGEGRFPFGPPANVTTDVNGDANWMVDAGPPGIGTSISATATGPSGTSEFSGTATMESAPPVQFSQAVYTVAENGGSINITVTRTGQLNTITTANYSTSNNTAVAGSDYTTASGTITFNPGETSKTFNVPITNDALDEPTEIVNLSLSGIIGGTFGTPTTAQLQITDDDPPPAILINDVTLGEGNAGATNFVFTISLSAVSGQQVQVNYTTTNGSATAGSDYTTTSGTATIPAGSLSTQVTVPVAGDVVVEPDETFTVDLSVPVNATISDNQGLGTITNDEGLPTITINDVPLAEGNAGTTSFTFTLTLSAQSATPVTVNYATADGTGAAPGDYTATSGVAAFAPLSTSTTVTVLVNGDTTFEPNETFFVNLTAPSGATFGDNQGLGTITNDDLTADLSVLKTANTPTFTSGQSITFTITVTNNGPGAATSATVTDILPAGTTFVSASPGCTGTTTVTCNLGTLASGANAAVSIVVTATGNAAITNTATAASATADGTPANNSGSVTVAAAPAEAIPTLSTWVLMLLGAALALVALRKV